MATVNKAQAESLLQSVGFSIDWSKVDWKNIWAIVQAIMALFLNQPTPAPAPVLKAGKSCEPDCCDCLKAHFDCIQTIAACGSQCCCGQTPSC